MIIKSIHIKEGIFRKYINFSDNVNLVYSEKNSKGKTTLLRFLLYSLGYNVPNTKKIKFERCEVETVIFSEAVGKIKLIRTERNNIVLDKNDKRTTYVLPEQQNEVHSIIFKTDNRNIIENLLGAFYVDQEKGWTLLNRGIVIGSIRFNIEELIRGLSGRDCIDLIQQEKKLSCELGKYKQIFSVAKYQETIEKENGSLALEHYDEKINFELEQLKIKENALNKELKRIDNTLKNNKQFSKFISEMKLLIKGENGSIIPITADNIIGFDDSFHYLITKHKITSAELAFVRKSIFTIEQQVKHNEEQLSFWKPENMLHYFDRRIASIQINALTVSHEIKRIEKELHDIRQEITDKTKNNNTIVVSLYENVSKYSTELGINNSSTMAASYLFTSNLKELSGAILHKTVFAFKLAYILEIERIIGIKLPIILDSPSGKEVDYENIKLMMNILKRDFSDHQIIISSIFQYDFDPLNVIEIKNRLIEAVQNS